MEKPRIEREEKRVEKDKPLELLSKDAASLLPPVVDELVRVEEEKQKQSPILSDPLKDFIVFAKHLSLEQRPSVKPGSFLESYGKIHLALHQLSEKVNDYYKAYNQVMEGKEEYKRLFAQEPDKYDAIAEKLNRWIEKANSLIDEYNEGVFISEQVIAQISPLFSGSSADPKRYLAKHLPFFPYSKETELSFASALFEPIPPPRDYSAIFEGLLEKRSLPKLSALVPLLSMERWEKELLGIEKDYLSYLDGLIQKGFFSLEFDREILSGQLARSPYLIHSVQGVVESVVEERGKTLDEAVCQTIAHRLNILMEEALSTLMFTSVKKSVEFFSLHQGVNQERIKRAISSLFFLENVLELVKSEEWNIKLLDSLSEISLSLKEQFSGIEQTVNLSLIATGIQLMAIEFQLKGLTYSFAKAVLEPKSLVLPFEEQNNWAEDGRIFEAMKPLFSSEKQTPFSRAIFLQPKFWVSELTQKKLSYQLGIKENIPSYRLGRFLELSRIFGFSAIRTFEFMKFSSEIRAVEGLIVNAAKEVAQAMGQHPALAVVVVEALIEKAFEGLSWQELKEQSSFIVEQHASIETAVDKELLQRLVEVLHLHYPLLLQRQVIDLQASYLASRFIAILKSSIFEQDNLEAASSLKQLEEQLALRFQEAIENEALSLPSAWEKRIAHLFDLFLFSSREKRELLRKKFSLYSANLSFLTPLKEYVNELAQRESASALELLTAFTRRYFPESLGHLSVHHLTHLVEQTVETILRKVKESDLVRKEFVKAVQKALYMPSSWYKRSHFLYSIAFFLESPLEQEEKKQLFSLAGSLQNGALELQKGLQAESFLWPAAIAFTGDREDSFRQLLANGVQETPYFDQNLLRQVLLERRKEDPPLASVFLEEEITKDQDYWLLAMQEALSIEEAQKDWELFSLLADGSELEKKIDLVKGEDGLFLTLWLEERFLEQGFSERLSEVYAVLPQINLFASPFTLIEKAEDTKEVNFYPVLGHTTFKGYLEKLLARVFKKENLSLKQSLFLAKQVSDHTLAQTADLFCSSDFRRILFASMEQVIFQSKQPLEIEKKFTKLKLQKLAENIHITVPLRQEIMQKELELELYGLGMPLQKLEKKCFEVVRSVFKNFFSFTSLEAFLSSLEIELVEKGLVASGFAKEKLFSMQFGLVLKGEETMREFDFFPFSLQEPIGVFQSELRAYLNPELKEEAKALSERASEMIFGYKQDVSELVANPFSCYGQVKKILERFASEKREKALKSAIDSTIFISAPKFLTLKNLLLPGELFIWQSELQREENRENTRTESNRI